MKKVIKDILKKSIVNNLFIAITAMIVTSGSSAVVAQSYGKTINLNGTWDFEQTADAFPPRKFSRKCPVPGLIHLAQPRIDAYNKIFKNPEEYSNLFLLPHQDTLKQFVRDYRNLKYEPKYSWYRRMVDIPKELGDTEVTLIILKSQYVTQVYVNGQDMGQSIACYTPIRMRITRALKPGRANEILIRVGERIWLPPWATGSTDQEKVNYLPGIWDDVSLSFSGKQKIQKNLFLPSVKRKTVTVKFTVRSFYHQQLTNRDPKVDAVKVEIAVKEKKSGKVVATAEVFGDAFRDNETQLEATFPFPEFQTWSPEQPFLYEAEIKLYDGDKFSDMATATFGMRDFERRGRFFYLNDEKYYLRGTNITLHRFFDDPDCQALPWDREWVKKMLIDDPKTLGWNAMRICVGLVPDFWYDLADEYGMLFQNEWMYWQTHGWDQQIREEFTDWVWSDGNHPSIVIWDAINENWQTFVGNELIPELMKLDPTRIWDAGYMRAEDLVYEDPIDEPHPYRAMNFMSAHDPEEYIKNSPYLLGKMDDWEARHRRYLDGSAALIVNEYGWNWLWRDGKPAKLTKNAYDYLVGENATADQRRELQAYWLQCETEWLRAERSIAGILAFTHLTNNFGYTGDWYINDIKDLEPGPSLKWFKHAFAKTNVFIDLADQRYFPNGSYAAGEQLSFNLVGINDEKYEVSGNVQLLILDHDGNQVLQKEQEIMIPAYGRVNAPVFVELPEKEGGYLITTRFSRAGQDEVYKSRRFIRVGEGKNHVFPLIMP
jgi:beta-galactosidase